jgi:hypothetical protein
MVDGGRVYILLWRGVEREGIQKWRGLSKGLSARGRRQEATQTLRIAVVARLYCPANYHVVMMTNPDPKYFSL